VTSDILQGSQIESCSKDWTRAGAKHISDCKDKKPAIAFEQKWQVPTLDFQLQPLRNLFTIQMVA
jgi:hypothetical protein